MVIHAYSEDYLNHAQKILGDMMDYAVNTYEFSPNQFYEMFLVSDVSMQFQTGNPTYVAGKTGCELVKEVLRKSGLLIPELEDEMYLDKSPEYWCGWALAYYQWYTGRSFMKIYHAVSIEEILSMYPVYHEIDISKFVETINEKWDQYYVETNLKRLRMLAGLSQSWQRGVVWRFARSNFLNSVRGILTIQGRLMCCVWQENWDVKVRSCWKFKCRRRHGIILKIPETQ